MSALRRVTALGECTVCQKRENTCNYKIVKLGKGMDWKLGGHFSLILDVFGTSFPLWTSVSGCGDEMGLGELTYKVASNSLFLMRDTY